MDDRVCIVQFLHPGGEHTPKTGTAWNTGAHKRKFLRCGGRYLVDGAPRAGTIGFWGEWEPESVVGEAFADPLPDGPRWIYEPYYAPRASYRGLQNTDPFVFGDRFRYTFCLQQRRTGPSRVRHLARGSVVLFGSCLHGDRFVLDTLFVVAAHTDHCKRDHAKGLLLGRVPPAYDAATLAPWYANTVKRDLSYRLYLGATYEEPVAGMFSFVPCLPSGEGPRGFARPTIRIPGAISDKLMQGFKLDPRTVPDDAAGLWREVVRQVTDQGLRMGIGASLPTTQCPLG